MKHSGSFKKYSNGPVFGSIETGTMFNAFVWKQNGRFRMDVSWRPKMALAVTFSDDGIYFERFYNTFILVMVHSLNILSGCDILMPSTIHYL